MNKQEKRRVIFIAVTLLICCIVAIVVKNADNYIVGYADKNDILDNISKRTATKAENITITDICERGPYVFVSYHVDSDQSIYLLCYRLSWRWGLLQQCKILTIIGEASSSRSVDFSIETDDDNTILVFWGENLPDSTLTVSFEIDGAEVQKELSSMHFFIEPFIFISSTSSPTNICISSDD